MIEKKYDLRYDKWDQQAICCSQLEFLSKCHELDYVRCSLEDSGYMHDVCRHMFEYRGGVRIEASVKMEAGKITIVSKKRR